MDGQASDPQPYTITRQDHEPNYDPNNPGASTWTIHFRTAGGTESFITVPDAQYTMENVSGQLAARAQQIDAIGGLGGGQA